ncbi:MAG: hypothetical protein PHH38_06320 [Candidatus Cloacimonetes bacterium]|nr:hypothetical protein [Candidatus Cloacimonadota bacterium]
MDKLSFKNTEKSILWDIRYGDGLLWLYKGIAFVALFLALKVSLLMWLALILLFPIQHLIRKRWIIPRRGIVKQRYYSNRPKYTTMIIIVGYLYLMLITLHLFSTRISETMVKVMIFSLYLLLFVNWLVISYLEWDKKSLYPILDRIVILFLLIALWYIKFEFSVFLLLICIYGIFNIIAGTWQFISFIKNNPVQAHEG